MATPSGAPDRERLVDGATRLDELRGQLLRRAEVSSHALDAPHAGVETQELKPNRFKRRHDLRAPAVRGFACAVQVVNQGLAPRRDVRVRVARSRHRTFGPLDLT